MAHPQNYVAYHFEEQNGHLKRVVVPWKDPNPGQVVVKVLACGVCGTCVPIESSSMRKSADEVSYSDEHVRTQLLPTGLPRVPGHEILGEVAAVSQTEKKWKVDQRVGSGWHGGHCNQCSRCREGDFVTCANQAINGEPYPSRLFLSLHDIIFIGINRDGGYAEYVTLRSEAVASVPEDIDPAEAAPLLCAGITTFSSWSPN